MVALSSSEQSLFSMPAHLFLSAAALLFRCKLRNRQIRRNRLIRRKADADANRIMYRLVTLLGLLVLVSASRADELPLPRKVEDAAPPPTPTPGDKSPVDGNRELIDLRNEIARLQAARDAL